MFSVSRRNCTGKRRAKRWRGFTRSRKAESRRGANYDYQTHSVFKAARVSDPLPSFSRCCPDFRGAAQIFKPLPRNRMHFGLTVYLFKKESHPNGWLSFLAVERFECVIEAAGGGFIRQCAHCRIPLFAPSPARRKCRRISPSPSEQDCCFNRTGKPEPITNRGWILPGGADGNQIRGRLSRGRSGRSYAAYRQNTA